MICFLARFRLDNCLKGHLKYPGNGYVYFYRTKKKKNCSGRFSILDSLKAKNVAAPKKFLTFQLLEEDYYITLLNLFFFLFFSPPLCLLFLKSYCTISLGTYDDDEVRIISGGR